MSVSTHWWGDLYGRRFVHTIYPIDALPNLGACNYIAARPLPNGSREPFYIGQTGDGEVRFPDHEKFRPAIRLGATELHVYVGARSKQERIEIETALRNAHRTPLNEQPFAASHNALSGMQPARSRLAAAMGGVTAEPVHNHLAALTNAVAGLGLDSSSPFHTLAALGIKPDNSAILRNALLPSMGEAKPVNALNALAALSRRG